MACQSAAMARQSARRPIRPVKKVPESRLNRENSMCYITAHREHKKLDPKYKLWHTFDKPVDLSEYLASDGMYTIEFEITDIDYDGEKRGYFVPRLINHAFNIVRSGGRVELYQSWFKEFTYGHHVTFESEKHFREFLDEFRFLLENHQRCTTELFRLFNFRSFHKINRLREHTRNHGRNRVEYRIEIHH